MPVSLFPAAAARSGAPAIVGVRSACSDGQGTLADYVSAAPAVGLLLVAFTDPLTELTQEEFQRLQADREAASAAPDVLATPGIEFIDGSGLRWAFWSHRLVYPTHGLKPEFSATRGAHHRSHPVHNSRSWPGESNEEAIVVGSRTALSSFGGVSVDYPRRPD